MKQNSLLKYTPARLILWGAVLISLFVLAPRQSSAASMSLGPATGSYVVGSTFDILVSLNTEDQSINALRASINFPPDKLQVVPDATGHSIITVYSVPPRFDNQAGIIDLQGGIPGGINVSNGQIIKITFRVKSVGTAIVRFRDESQVLANDGLGTNVLKDRQNGIYELVLPPPSGPIVVSETHPDQSVWYSHPTVLLKWSADDPGVTGYSSVINDTPVDVPDDISEGIKTGVAYKNLGDGVKYFHIKSLRGEHWGGTTHFALNIDTLPPAEFPIEIIPGTRTTRSQPIIQFATTDNLSGLDHYELKIVPLSPGKAQAALTATNQPLFIEVVSPYVAPPLEKGSYSVIVRAYDRAGNSQEQAQKLKIVSSLFQPLGDRGVELRGQLVIPWPWFWIGISLLLALLAYLAVRLKHWHDQVHLKRLNRELPEQIASQISELKKFRQKYGKIAILLFAVSMVLGSYSKPLNALAQESVELSPPYVSSVPRNITNEEIFYVGGKTDAANIEVIIYLQNLQSGETISQRVLSDKKGEWFYTHDNFLTSGSYLLWTQSRLGDQVSPPSPQIQLNVDPTAIQFGASRISTEVLYLILILILFALVLILASYVIFHGLSGRKKHKLLREEVKKAEESVKRGFAVLRRDIEAELAVVRKAGGHKGKMSHAEQSREDQLLRDLADVEKYVGEEIWEIEQLEQKPGG
ncbi:MAG: cohesin domain-containing protein [Candidatus Doudnabacteria bacterium]|nr:cohesin domain-containing protein [Candidatus Doudnabacteria bacterium]